MSTDVGYYIETRRTPRDAWQLTFINVHNTEEDALRDMTERRARGLRDASAVEFRMVEMRSTVLVETFNDSAYRNADGELFVGGIVFDAKGQALLMPRGNPGHSLTITAHHGGWVLADDLPSYVWQCSARGTTPRCALTAYKQTARERLERVQATVKMLQTAYNRVCMAGEDAEDT